MAAQHEHPDTSAPVAYTTRVFSPDEMKTARKKFDDAGINVSAYNLSFNDSFTDEEIDRGFQLSKAFGVNVITASSTLTTAPRLVAGAADEDAPVSDVREARA